MFVIGQSNSFNMCSPKLSICSSSLTRQYDWQSSVTLKQASSWPTVLIYMTPHTQQGGKWH